MGMVALIDHNYERLGTEGSPARTVDAAVGRHNALTAVTSLLAGELTPEDFAQLRRAAATYLRHEGRLSFDRALHLPSGTQFRRAARDHYIIKALRLIDAPSGRARALELRRRLLTMACAQWRSWRALGGVPAEASALDAACFEVLSRGRDPAAPTVPSERLIRGLAALLR